MDSSQLNPNILALLTGGIQSRIGMGGQQQLPQFSGGQGLNPNLLALLMSSGQLQKHFDMNGNPMLPNAPGSSMAPTFGGLDAAHDLQRGIGSQLDNNSNGQGRSIQRPGFSYGQKYGQIGNNYQVTPQDNAAMAQSRQEAMGGGLPPTASPVAPYNPMHDRNSPEFQRAQNAATTYAQPFVYGGEAKLGAAALASQNAQRQLGQSTGNLNNFYQSRGTTQADSLDPAKYNAYFQQRMNEVGALNNNLDQLTGQHYQAMLQGNKQSRIPWPASMAFPKPNNTDIMNRASRLALPKARTPAIY